MKLLIGLIEVACLSILCMAQPSRPGPEIAKMAVYAGQWRYEGESEPGPSGPADRYSGYAIGKLILNGFYFEWRWKDRGTTGTQEGFEIIGYNPVHKSYSSNWFVDDGIHAPDPIGSRQPRLRIQGSVSVEGNNIYQELLRFLRQT